MKKLFFVLVLVIITSNSEAQFVRGYWLKLGTTISNQEWNYKDASGLSNASFDSDNKIGFNVGLFVEFLDMPFISVVTELGYIKKGMKNESPIRTLSQPGGTGEYKTWDTRIDYINLSAFGKIRFDAALFSPYILLGPKFDLEISRNNSLDIDSTVDRKSVV